jgi:anaerobic magnesium-protoporphyrin IX monomethyl ester cyclase
MLDLLLVNPGNSSKMYQSLASQWRSIEPPWWCGVLASFIRDSGYDVNILDADARNLSPKETSLEIFKAGAKLVVIVVQGCNPSASSTPKMSSVKDLTEELFFNFKERSFKVALCGVHPSALPVRTLKENKVDYVISGEGFYSIREILSGNYYNAPGVFFYEDGIIRGNPLPHLLHGNELPPVAWDLLNMREYRAPTWPCMKDPDNRSPHAVIYSSIGCPFNCNFCQVKCLYNNKPGIRFRPVENVMKEIDLLVNKYGIRHLRIVDELFTVNERRVSSICEPLIKRGYDLNMWQYARTDTVTLPMIKKMKQAGMPWLGLGIESVSNVSLKGINKRNTLQDIENSVEWAREADVGIMANFIFGLPDDTLETMQGNLDMMKEYLFDYVNLYTCMAYPGSTLYCDVALNHNDWLPDTWDGYSQLGYETKPLPTKYLTANQVLAFRDFAFNDYFSYPPYQAKIKRKYGDMAVKRINEMLKHKLVRKLL